MTLPTRSGPKRKLRVDLTGLETAFHDLSFETHYFLDRQTGAVARITGTVWRQLESVYEELNRAGDHNLNGFNRVCHHRNLSEDEQHTLEQAHHVECGLGSRYIALPPAHPHMELRDMEDYIATIHEPGLCELLWKSLRNSDPSHHFTEVLSRHPGQPESWRAFHDEQIKVRIRIWLAEEGIDPVE